jgi:hypothetical protein
MTTLPMHTITGSSRSTITIAMAPGTASPYWLVRPGLNLHSPVGGQRGNTDG